MTTRKAAHPNPAGRAMRACESGGKCRCRILGFDRATCEHRYKVAVREIIDETVWASHPTLPGRAA